MKETEPCEQLDCKEESASTAVATLNVPGETAVLRLWEIDRFYKCPIVGLCLTIAEQKQILKKARVLFRSKTDFEIHEILVAASERQGPLSERMERLLNRKFARDIKAMRDLDEKRFMECWKASFRSGAYAGVFWIAAIKPDLSPHARIEIFGSVHMAMHKNAEQYARLKQQAAFHEERAAHMAGLAKEETRARRRLQKEVLKLQRAETDRLRRPDDSRKMQPFPAQGVVIPKDPIVDPGFLQEYERLKAEIVLLKDRIAERDASAEALAKTNKRLSQEVDQHKEWNVRLQEELKALNKALLLQNRCDASCPSFDLCKRRVLLVGGLTKMEAFYRQMVEDRGGIFEYHDGYMKNGIRNLESQLKRADIVLCPINCNSHAACSLVKNLGKKHNKSVRMLSSPSLSTLAEALSGKGGVCISGT